MDTMREKITFLYPERADEVYQRLRQIIDDFKKIYPRKGTLEFSEKDVVLICYADHVYKQHNYLSNDRVQSGTLKTLHQFLLKYAKNLINKIHLLPFYPYSSDDGFSVVDYCQVKKELGDWEDIREIGNDFGLMFDFVVNHVSSKSEWSKKFLAGDPKYKDYFIAFDKKVDTSSVYRPRTNPLLTPFKMMGPIAAKTAVVPDELISKTAAVNYVWTTFSSDQIDLNYKNPEVLLEMIKVFLFYIQQGVLIIRLDAVRYLWKELGTSCVDLPQSHMIVKLLRQILVEVAPEVRLISEVKGSLDKTLSYFGDGHDETHLVYNFQLPALLLYAFFKGEATELTKWARGLKTPSSKTAFFNVTATHDGIGLTPLKGFMSDDEITKFVNYVLEKKGFVNYHSVGEKLEPYELNIVYLDALGGVKQFLASQAVQLSLQGVPGVYFNSFIGAENWYEGVEKLGDNRAINREKFNYDKLMRELESKGLIKNQVYSGYQKLLQARINEPLFSPSASQEVVNLHSKIFAVVRFDSQNKLLCLTNISNERIEIDAEVIIKLLEKNEVRNLISGQEINLKNRNVLLLDPYQIFWLK